MEKLADRSKYIYVACPWTPKGGGMFKVADYLIQSQGQPKSSEDAVLKSLDTRGGHSAGYSAWVMTLAVLKLAWGRLTGRLAGVHVNMAERLSLFRKGAIIATCRALGIPVVLHLHAAQLHHFYRDLPVPLKALTRWFFALSSHCVVLGNASKAFVTQTLKVPESRVEIVTNGVPPPSVARRISRPGEPRRVLFLGNLSERKGVSDLLKAVAQSGFSPDKVQVSIAGGGDVEAYTQLANELGVASIVHFVGWADQSTAARLMAESDDEGLPLVILEALANGVAVICTPVGEIPTALTDGENACFVKPGDIPDIAAGLHRVLDDDAFRTTLEANGRAIYLRDFSMQNFFTSISAIHKTHFGVSAQGTESPSHIPGEQA
jgi:glycosyltransferase involved in cell wall biosynthesis